MTYEVVLTKDAENDLDNFIQYLLFERHRYFMLYRIEGERIIVDNIFHELQDFEGKMIQNIRRAINIKEWEAIQYASHFLHTLGYVIYDFEMRYLRIEM